MNCIVCANLGKHESPVGGMYCGKHKKFVMRDINQQKLDESTKLCEDERCKTFTIVPKNTKFCDLCLERRQKKNKTNTGNRVAKIASLEIKYANKIVSGFRICKAKTCARRNHILRHGKEEDILWTVEEFTTSDGKVVTKCSECLEKQRQVESKRGKRDRDYKSYEERSERKTAKKAYRDIPENKAKALEASQRYRKKEREKD